MVFATSCPPTAGPQVDSAGLKVYSVALVPPRTPFPMPVKGTLPVLVSVNIWAGSRVQPGFAQRWFLGKSGLRLRSYGLLE